MSKRLQVLLPDGQFRDLRRIAKAHGMTVGGWVRQSLAEACRREPERRVERVLAALDRALAVNGPTADIEQMNAEVERGYLGDLES